MKISELKGKHDHALTSWLKVIIFSLLMIAPLFASISQWVYVSVNKNAKDSYSNQRQVITEYKTNDVYSLNDLVVGRAYTYTYDSSITNEARLGIEKILLNNDLNTYNFNYIPTNYDTTIRINYRYNSIDYDSFTITPLNTNNNGYTTLNSVDFIYGNSNYNQNADVIISCISKCLNLPVIEVENENGTLDNAFYYGVEKMTQSDLFNWTQNTTLYTGIKTMTDNLEIQTPAIAILLTYWFILTIIYVIIDIVLKGFTTLTHLIMGAKN